MKGKDIDKKETKVINMKAGMKETRKKLQRKGSKLEKQKEMR